MAAAGRNATVGQAPSSPAKSNASNEGFANIGLPPEAGWYVSSALYWIAGFGIILIDQLAPGAVDPTITVLGALSLAASPLMLLGAHFTPDASWGASVRLLFPVIVFSIGAFVADTAITALGIFYLFPLLAVAYMHRPTVSVPFCTISLAAMFAAFVIYDDSSEGLAWAIVFCGSSGALVAGLIIAQRHLRRVASESHERSITDPLTGLANLRGLRAHLQQEIQRSTRDGSEIMLFAIDLDDFKEVNDNFSYALGDTVLKEVAAAIEQELEPGDLVARRGGDEFAIVALVTPGRHMARFTDRIGAAIERTRRATCPAVNPRASITREAHTPGESVDELILRVDDGLHSAKIDAHPERLALKAEVDRRPPEPGDESQSERMQNGARRARASMDFASGARVRGDRQFAWMMCAGVAFVSSALLTLVALPGLLGAGRNYVSLAAVLLLLILGAACLSAARSDTGPRLLQLPVALTLLFNLAAVAAAGESAHVLAVLCLLPVPLAVFVLGLRTAAPYLLVGSAAYLGFELSSSAPYAELQASVMLVVMSVLILMLARGKRMSDEFSIAAEAISIVDPLTGAVNIRGMRQRIEQEISRAESTGEELCIVMIDLERFKAVNDFYSHSTGDLLLIDTTRAIESVVREDELVARRGGDEFAVVCAPAIHRDMSTLTDRISLAISEARSVVTPDIPGGATVVAVFRNPQESASQLLERADEELRLVKAGERKHSLD